MYFYILTPLHSIRVYIVLLQKLCLLLHSGITLSDSAADDVLVDISVTPYGIICCQRCAQHSKSNTPDDEC